MEPAVELFSSKTVMTTKVPVNLMIPLPLTGRWAPGPTLKVATLVAQDLINNEQKMLPGYRILYFCLRR